MIQCPKCNFPQPQDIYCANCGIEISTYKKKESFANLLNNWIVHVLIIIICIITFVLYDKIYNKKTSPQSISNTIPNATNTNSNPSEEQFSQPNTQAPRENETPPVNDLSQRDQNEIKVEKKAQSPDNRLKVERKNQPDLQVSFYKISRAALTELQRRSQIVSVSGEAVAGQLPKERLAPLIKSADLQYISSNRYKDFDDEHPKMIFKGQRHTEAARNLGLFFQISALRKLDIENLIEIKGWGALKTLDPDENYFMSEMTLTPTNTAFIAGFVPRTGKYTEDEKLLFENDRLLKELIEEEFSDGSADIIMLIEFNSSR